MWGMQSKVRVYLVAQGRTVEWTDVATLRRGGDKDGKEKKKKDRNPWHSSEESSSGDTASGTSSGEERTEDEWVYTVSAALEEWWKKSREEGGKMHASQAVQMSPREEMIRQHGEMIREVADLNREVAMMSMRWMVEEKAKEKERRKLEELITEKDREGCFRSESGPNEDMAFGKHQGKRFKDVSDGPKLLPVGGETETSGVEAEVLEILRGVDGRHEWEE